MYISICIYAYVYMHMYICICIYAYVYMHMYISICIFIYVNVYMYMYICICVYICLHNFQPPQMTHKTTPEQLSSYQAKRISHLKNIDSKHANLILNEIVER